ncbi:hypothetical protein XAP412_790073 [Xanthomonas phaseoli pv. phaseoli]|uniref:Transposase n=1 Tax=Xanthomonas campestris pv. phaseoli TaxID=317013 RepID=A0AB38E646_XANCH|nr:hypothetical protein XAP6984_830074 [Xanthomonas phaseoli pv. phaseoli]SON90658.1 hypothetical protein XAP412_790073 [Xanthomonas phaseoli pv. phaseoli]SON92590.1 hypothetical protein XAP7430_790073 [Xanthomonas phaseoli pv. phaseoli]SOO29497.1 hypothetical protein XAP6164_3380004 [Xanthomonas phaseoli pv. phaseoli]
MRRRGLLDPGLSGRALRRAPRCDPRPHPALRATFSRLREKEDRWPRLREKGEISGLPLAEKGAIGARTVLLGAGADALKLTFRCRLAWRHLPDQVTACLPFSRAAGEDAQVPPSG